MSDTCLDKEEKKKESVLLALNPRSYELRVRPPRRQEDGAVLCPQRTARGGEEVPRYESWRRTEVKLWWERMRWLRGWEWVESSAKRRPGIFVEDGCRGGGLLVKEVNGGVVTL